MTVEQVIKELENISDKLNTIQETEIIQNNVNAMLDIGKAIGNIENTIDILRNIQYD